MSTPARTRTLLIVLAYTTGLLALTLADHWLWQHLRVANKQWLEGRDWYQFLRALGYLPTWLFIGAAFLLHDSRSSDLHTRLRGLLIALSAALGGGAAELVKITTHRLRPGETGEYLFAHFLSDLTDPGADKLRQLGFGLASSHAGVAFGGAFMLIRLFPRTAPAAITLATGCALSRLLAGAHFATDVYVGAGMSYAVAAAIWHFRLRTLNSGLRT